MQMQAYNSSKFNNMHTLALKSVHVCECLYIKACFCVCVWLECPVHPV